MPFLLSDPDIESGPFREPVSLIDLAPTVLDLAGAPVPDEFDGSSLVGFSEEDAADRPAVSFWEGHVSVRSGTWRYTAYDQGGEELYDLSTDPQEFTNLADDPAHAAQLDQLRPMVP